MCQRDNLLCAVQWTIWMWTGALWAWALIEVVAALDEFAACGSHCTDLLIAGTVVGAGQAVGLWFLSSCRSSLRRRSCSTAPKQAE